MGIADVAEEIEGPLKEQIMQSMGLTEGGSQKLVLPSAELQTSADVGHELDGLQSDLTEKSRKEQEKLIDQRVTEQVQSLMQEIATIANFAIEKGSGEEPDNDEDENGDEDSGVEIDSQGEVSEAPKQQTQRSISSMIPSFGLSSKISSFGLSSKISSKKAKKFYESQTAGQEAQEEKKLMQLGLTATFKETADLDSNSWLEWSQVAAHTLCTHDLLQPGKFRVQSESDESEQKDGMGPDGVRTVFANIIRCMQHTARNKFEQEQKEALRGSGPKPRPVMQATQAQIAQFKFVTRIDDYKKKWEERYQDDLKLLEAGPEDEDRWGKATVQPSKDKGECIAYMNEPLPDYQRSVSGFHDKLGRMSKTMKNAVKGAMGAKYPRRFSSRVMLESKNGICKFLARYLALAVQGIRTLTVDPVSPLLKSAQPARARERSKGLLDLSQLGGVLHEAMNRADTSPKEIGMYKVPSTGKRQPIYGFTTEKGYKSHGFNGAWLGAKTQVGVACQDDTFSVLESKVVKYRTYYRVVAGWIAPCENADSLRTYLSRANVQGFLGTIWKNHKMSVLAGVATFATLAILGIAGIAAPQGLAAAGIAYGVGVLGIAATNAYKAVRNSYWGKKHVFKQLVPRCDRSSWEKFCAGDAQQDNITKWETTAQAPDAGLVQQDELLLRDPALFVDLQFCRMMNYRPLRDWCVWQSKKKDKNQTGVCKTVQACYETTPSIPPYRLMRQHCAWLLWHRNAKTRRCTSPAPKRAVTS